MAYRSTKEKFAAHAKARDLYVKDGLSLKEVSQQTGATLRTLGTWRNLGDWKNLREEAAKTDLDRLEEPTGQPARQSRSPDQGRQAAAHRDWAHVQAGKD